MYSFLNDYSEFAHENLLKAISENARTKAAPYGNDDFCEKAKNAIKKHLETDNCEIYFLEGGTQTNLTLISAALRPYQGILSAVTGHINCHESGAIEATGHKVIGLESVDGKITAAQIDDYVTSHYADENFEHVVQPKLVYISNPTEVGTIYTKQELEEISDVCLRENLYLYLDGARLGTALTSDINDISLADLAYYCDASYIGGTKMGALYGEALVITNPDIYDDFRYIQKQKGALAAKSFGIGIQFYELFKQNLYFELADHANKMARKLENGILSKGYSMRYDTHTNQIFPIFPLNIIQNLKIKFKFSSWENYSKTEDVIRLCTSWATDEKSVDAFIASI